MVVSEVRDDWNGRQSRMLKENLIIFRNLTGMPTQTRAKLSPVRLSITPANMLEENTISSIWKSNMGGGSSKEINSSVNTDKK